MATILNAVSGTGLTQTADGSGVMKVQSNGVTTNALAWVNFNGVTTATIRASYNISSVSRTAAGAYTINFTNAMSDANYVGSASLNGFVSSGGTMFAPVSTTSCTVTTMSNGAQTDMATVTIAIFGN